MTIRHTETQRNKIIKQLDRCDEQLIITIEEILEYKEIEKRKRIEKFLL